MTVLYASSASAFSGGEESLCQLSEALSAYPVSRCALVGMRGRFTRRLAEAGVAVSVADGEFVRPTLGNWRYLRRAIASMNPDVIHLNGPNGTPILAAAEDAGVPVVQHVRSVALDEFRECLEAAAATIAVSTFVAHEIVRQGLLVRRVTVIHNGVDCARFRRVGNIVAKRRWTRGPVTVLVVARRVAWKRYDLAFAVLRVLRQQDPSTRVLFVGEHAADVSVERQFAEGCEALRGHVTALGWIPDIRRVLSDADVLLHCAERDPLPRIVLEAMASGVPVVAMASGGVPEIIRSDAVGVLVPHGDVEAAASAMFRLSKDREWADALAVNALSTIQREFSAKRCAEQVWGVYRQVVGRTARVC